MPSRLNSYQPASCNRLVIEVLSAFDSAQREGASLKDWPVGCLPATECARRAGYSEWVAKKATFIIDRAPLVALVLKEHRRREDEEFERLVKQFQGLL